MLDISLTSEDQSTLSPKKIIVDWGTTNFRAYLVTNDGNLLDYRKSNHGIQNIKQGQFEDFFYKEVLDWFKKNKKLEVTAFGMVTSKNGWVETPYIPCPVSPNQLVSSIIRKKLRNGANINFLPGVSYQSAYPFTDVMRGEEIQVLGFGIDNDVTMVLPGTHSKWVKIKNQRIDNFKTFVTGELYSLISQYSFIGKTDQIEKKISWDTFSHGIEIVKSDPLQANAMLSLLFSGRTGILSGKIVSTEVQDYLSGLLIALEIFQAKQSGLYHKGDTIGLITDDTNLCERYQLCSEAFGLRVKVAANDTTLKGAILISQLHAKESYI